MARRLHLPCVSSVARLGKSWNPSSVVLSTATRSTCDTHGTPKEPVNVHMFLLQPHGLLALEIPEDTPIRSR
jgi:hypothetical protein